MAQKKPKAKVVFVGGQSGRGAALSWHGAKIN